MSVTASAYSRGHVERHLVQDVCEDMRERYSCESIPSNYMALWYFPDPPSAAEAGAAIFISGVPRSGTSALGGLLNLHPRISLLIERYAFQFGYHPDMFRTRAIYEDGWESHPHAKQWRSLRPKLESSVYVGDKRPNFLLGWSITRENFEPDDIRIIHIARSIEEIALSFDRRASGEAGDRVSWRRYWDHRVACDWFNLNNRRVMDVACDPMFSSSLAVVGYRRVFTEPEAAPRLFDWLDLDVSAAVQEGCRRHQEASAEVVQRDRQIAAETLEYLTEHVDAGLWREVQSLERR